MGVQLSGLSEQGSFFSLRETKHSYLRFSQRLACPYEALRSEGAGSYFPAKAGKVSVLTTPPERPGPWRGILFLASGPKRGGKWCAYHSRGTYRVPARLRELIRTPGWPLALPDVVKCRQGKDAGVTAGETALCSMIDTSRPCAHCEYPETHAFAGSVPNTPWEWVPDLIAPICEWCKRLIMARSGLLRQQDDVPEI